MRAHTARPAILSEIATYDAKSAALRAVIETPRGSRNKYAYDPDSGAFALATVLPEGMTFPFDFGFIPSTLGDDGDPVDVLVLMDAPVPCGCLLECRLLGVIEARQKDKGKPWIRNDRLIAVACHARSHNAVNTLRELPRPVLHDIQAFFVDYNRLDDKTFRPLGVRGPRRAEKLVKKGGAVFKKQRRDAEK
jgi:inorganic pyrophosphatase